MKALILAAGLGTRLKPVTEKIPKALVEVSGTPLIEIVINKLKASGFKELIINVHHFADQVISFLERNSNFGIDIQISDERNLLLDTGGAIKNAAQMLCKSKSYLVHNVDILADFPIKNLCDNHLSNKCIATLAVQKRESSRYFLFDDEKNLCGWKNIKTGEVKMSREPSGKLESFAFSGIHIADYEILKLFPAQNVFSLVDFFLYVASIRQITYFDHTNSHFIDLGKIENLKLAEDLFKNSFRKELKNDT